MVSPAQLAARNAGTAERDLARAAVGDLRQATMTIEHIVRSGLATTPTPLVERARVMLRRYFSACPWRIDDESALAALAGRGLGWQTLTLDCGVNVSFGWRGTGFRVIAEPRIVDGAPLNQPSLSGQQDPTPLHPFISLEASFDGPVAVESKLQPRVIGFLVGPTTHSATTGWARRNDVQMADSVRRIFHVNPNITGVHENHGCYEVELCEAELWYDTLAVVLTHVTHNLARPRPPCSPTREETRTRKEFLAHDLRSPRGRILVRQSVEARDPIVRELAVAAVAIADPFSAPTVWKRAISDYARNVRRAAIREIVRHNHAEVRPLLERALQDVDGYTRFKAIHGIAAIGMGPSSRALDRVARDPDARVRVAAAATLLGRPPPD